MFSETWLPLPSRGGGYILRWGNVWAWYELSTPRMVVAPFVLPSLLTAVSDETSVAAAVRVIAGAKHRLLRYLQVCTHGVPSCECVGAAHSAPHPVTAANGVGEIAEGAVIPFPEP